MRLLFWRVAVLVAVCLVAVAPGVSQAAGIEVYAIGGHASLAMSDFNEKIIDLVNDSGELVEQFGGHFEPAEHVDRALWGEAGLRFSVTPAVQATAGIRYMAPNGTDFTIEDLNQVSHGTMRASLWGPVVTLGLPITMDGSPLSFHVAGTLSYNMFSLSEDAEFDDQVDNANDWDSTVTYGGRALGYGLRGGLAYSFGERASLSATVGYEWLRFDKVTVTAATARNFPAPDIGDPLTDPIGGKPLPIDLSGLRIAAALSVSF